MATVRRLSDEDVQSVFDCIYGNMLPPPRLAFHIIPIGHDGLRLSPPSHQFDDGIYILLKPCKDDRVDLSIEKYVPSNLKSLVCLKYRDCKSCPWSLSGPQFPQPSSFQQRYCYPRGDPTYSDGKGGALWTKVRCLQMHVMIVINLFLLYFLTNYEKCVGGKEIVEYRLLHVYHSTKRAINKGLSGNKSSTKRRHSAIMSQDISYSSYLKSTSPSKDRSHLPIQFEISTPTSKFVTPDQKLDGNDKKNLEENCWDDYKSHDKHSQMNSFIYPNAYHFNQSPFYYSFNPYYYMHPQYNMRHQGLPHHQSSTPKAGKSERFQPITSLSTSPKAKCNKKSEYLEFDDTVKAPISKANTSPTHSIIEAALNIDSEKDISESYETEDDTDFNYVPSALEEANIMLEFETCWMDPIPISDNESSTDFMTASVSAYIILTFLEYILNLD